MRKMQIIAAAIVLLCSCSKDAIKEDAFCLFDDKALPSVSVNIHEAEWQRLLDFYDKDSRTKEYIHCDVTFSQGARAYRLNDVGLRLRGQTSRRRPVGRSGGYRHFHFGLHFRKFDEDSKQEIDGHRRINFKYAKEDPTYIREHYCHDLMARFGVWTAPKSSWCRLWLNVGENDPLYYGVYLMNESIDKQYLKRRPGFGSREGV